MSSNLERISSVKWRTNASPPTGTPRNVELPDDNDTRGKGSSSGGYSTSSSQKTLHFCWFICNLAGINFASRCTIARATSLAGPQSTHRPGTSTGKLNSGRRAQVRFFESQWRTLRVHKHHPAECRTSFQAQNRCQKSDRQ